MTLPLPTNRTEAMRPHTTSATATKQHACATQTTSELDMQPEEIQYWLTAIDSEQISGHRPLKRRRRLSRPMTPPCSDMASGSDNTSKRLVVVGDGGDDNDHETPRAKRRLSQTMAPSELSFPSVSDASSDRSASSSAADAAARKAARVLALDRAGIQFRGMYAVKDTIEESSTLKHLLRALQNG